MPVPRFEGSFARRRDRCGKILEPEQVAAVEAALAGYTVVLLGQAGTGKTLTLSEIALELQARRPDKHIAQILDSCSYRKSLV